MAQGDKSQLEGNLTGKIWGNWSTKIKGRNKYKSPKKQEFINPHGDYKRMPSPNCQQYGKSARIGKNDQFATITVKNASGKNHQWKLYKSRRKH